LVNLDQSNKFITQKYYVFKKGERNRQDELNLELPYLSAKLVQLSNYTPRTKLVVKYKRNTEANENLTVYLGTYDPKTKRMVFEDHSLKDTSTFLLDVFDYSAEGKPYVAYLLFVNTSTGEPVIVDYDLTVRPVPDLRYFDDFVFASQWGGTNLPIHRLAWGESSELTTLTIIPVVYRIYAEQYYSTLYWESNLEGNEIHTRAWSDWVEQEVSYNFLTGHCASMSGKTGVDWVMRLRWTTGCSPWKWKGFVLTLCHPVAIRALCSGQRIRVKPRLPSRA
jgi:hypothetical protein